MQENIGSKQATSPNNTSISLPLSGSENQSIISIQCKTFPSPTKDQAFFCTTIECNANQNQDKLIQRMPLDIIALVDTSKV